MMPSAQQEFLHGALGWVNHVRHSMGAKPIPDFPKSIPGSESDCLLARAIKADNHNCIRVRIGTGSYQVEYRPRLRPRMEMCSTRYAESGDPISLSMDAPRMAGDQGELPYPCKKVVRMFDHGDLPQYIAEEETTRRNKHATPPHLQPPSLYDLHKQHEAKAGITATEVLASMQEAFAGLCPVPPMPALKYVPELPKFVKTPNWAKLSEIPEAPVKVLAEEPITV